MNIAMAYFKGDRELAIKWLNWVKELGGLGNHKLFLIRAFDCDPIPEVLPFTEVKDEECQTEPKGQQDWQSREPMRSASAPNSMFRQLAWKFYNEKLGPYLFIEPDCIPLVTGWHDKLWDEYVRGGKPFCGAKVLIESVPEHLTGNSIYVDVPELAPSLVRRTNWTPAGQPRSFELAFDIAGAREVLQKCHFTTLIQHKFRFKGFESRYEFDAVIDKNAVVFHSDKKGTIYKYLRENLSGVKETLDDAVRPYIEQYKNICGGVGEVIASGGIATEPASSQTTTEGSAIGFTRTFTPSDDLENVIAQNAVIKNGLPAMSPPWENREDSERDVKMLCDTLKLFCGAPVYKGRVREALREAKIIK